MPQQLDFIIADAHKMNGINVAVLNADSYHPEWSEQAYTMLLKFLDYHDGEFMAEDVRMFAQRQGLQDPPSKRAWGAIILRANREKFIEFVGYQRTKNIRAHLTPAGVWRKNINGR